VCLVFGEVSSASASGANDWFELSDVQLEAGSVASPFERRDYGRELMMCQRYGEPIPYHIVSMNAITGNDCYTFAPFKVEKRAAPTMINGVDLGNNGYPAGLPTFTGYVNGVRALKTANGNFPNGFFIFSAFASSEL
jgi:hypothetical protein